MTEENNKKFREDLSKNNDPIENWPTAKLKKEAGNDQGQGQNQVIDKGDLGIE